MQLNTSGSTHAGSACAGQARTEGRMLTHSAPDTGTWLQEARSLAALQTDEDIDSDSDSGTSSDTGHYSGSGGLGSSGDSGCSSSGLSSGSDSGCDSSSSSSGLSSGGGGGRGGGSTEPSQGNSAAGGALASSAGAGESVPEWCDDVALALARAAGPMLREPVLNELYVEWAEPFAGFMAL